MIDKDQRFEVLFENELIFRGEEKTSKEGFTMTNYCVLLKDCEQMKGFILGFKTKNHWKDYHKHLQGCVEVWKKFRFWNFW